MAETVHGAGSVGGEQATAVNGADATIIITVHVNCQVFRAAEVLCVVPRGFGGWDETRLSHSVGTATEGTKQRGRCRVSCGGPKGQNRVLNQEGSQVGLFGGRKKEAAASTPMPVGSRPRQGRVTSARNTHLDHAVFPNVDVA